MIWGVCVYDSLPVLFGRIKQNLSTTLCSQELREVENSISLHFTLGGKKEKRKKYHLPLSKLTRLFSPSFFPLELWGAKQMLLDSFVQTNDLFLDRKMLPSTGFFFLIFYNVRFRPAVRVGDLGSGFAKLFMQQECDLCNPGVL